MQRTWYTNDAWEKFLKESNKITEQEDEFLKQKGYTSCFKDKHPTIDAVCRNTPFISSNGTKYNNAQEFHKGTGNYPRLEKNGICYGREEALKIESSN